MRSVLAFCAFLVVVLGLLTWGAVLALNTTTRGWFERDVALRAELAVSGSRRALVSAWRAGQWQEVGRVLADMTHDERILGAAVCTAGGKTLTRTGDYPGAFACADIARHVFEASPAGGPWRTTAMLRGGEVHASALPLGDDAGALGAVVLVHDMSFVARREATTRRFLLLAFAVLAVIRHRANAAIEQIPPRVSRGSGRSSSGPSRRSAASPRASRSAASAPRSSSPGRLGAVPIRPTLNART